MTFPLLLCVLSWCFFSYILLIFFSSVQCLHHSMKKNSSALYGAKRTFISLFGSPSLFKSFLWSYLPLWILPPNPRLSLEQLFLPLKSEYQFLVENLKIWHHAVFGRKLVDNSISASSVTSLWQLEYDFSPSQHKLFYIKWRSLCMLNNATSKYVYFLTLKSINIILHVLKNFTSIFKKIGLRNYPRLIERISIVTIVLMKGTHEES